jgi:high mobility group protein B1
MSEHQRGAWGSREDAVWWPTSITTTDQQNIQHHQHLLNQHQQQLVAQQHQVVVQNQHQQQQQHDTSRSTPSTVATQQLFSYKMASSFPNPATTMAGVVSTSNSSVGAYDYRLGMSTMVARPGDPTTMTSATPGTQWWYTTQQNVDNTIQQNQHQSQQNQHQNVHNVTTTPSVRFYFLNYEFSKPKNIEQY